MRNKKSKIVYKIKYLIMDVDGTLTDGKIYIGDSGEAFKAFNVKDGCGIHDILIPAGIVPVIMTGRRSKILENRCIELGIKNLFQGIGDKAETTGDFLKSCKADYDNVAYIGDDINDIPCMELVNKNGGLTGCPADASKKVTDICAFVSSRNGGEGAVRDFIEWLLLRSV